MFVSACIKRIYCEKGKCIVPSLFGYVCIHISSCDSKHVSWWCNGMRGRSLAPNNCTCLYQAHLLWERNCEKGKCIFPSLLVYTFQYHRVSWQLLYSNVFINSISTIQHVLINIGLFTSWLSLTLLIRYFLYKNAPPFLYFPLLSPTPTLGAV